MDPRNAPPFSSSKYFFESAPLRAAKVRRGWNFVRTWRHSLQTIKSFTIGRCEKPTETIAEGIWPFGVGVQNNFECQSQEEGSASNFCWTIGLLICYRKGDLMVTVSSIGEFLKVNRGIWGEKFVEIFGNTRGVQVSSTGLYLCTWILGVGWRMMPEYTYQVSSFSSYYEIMAS